MVLGFILYEAVDLVWNFGGMTFRGAKGAYNWYYEGIKKIGPSRSGAFINLVPIFAAVLSTIIFKEEVTRSFVIGAILVFVGVYITNRIKSQKI